MYRTRAQARAEVFDYVERLYNPIRRNSMPGYISPIKFEKAQEAWVSGYDTDSSPTGQSTNLSSGFRGISS